MTANAGANRDGSGGCCGGGEEGEDDEEDKDDEDDEDGEDGEEGKESVGRRRGGGGEGGTESGESGVAPAQLRRKRYLAPLIVSATYTWSQPEQHGTFS
jgi:hypothetical protein